MSIAATGSVVLHFDPFFCSSDELNITLPQLRTRTLLGIWLGNYSQLLYVFISPSCTVEITSKFNLLSYKQQHSIYLFNFPVKFPYCMLSLFFRLTTMIIKMTEIDLWLQVYWYEYATHVPLDEFYQSRLQNLSHDIVNPFGPIHSLISKSTIQPSQVNVSAGIIPIKRTAMWFNTVCPLWSLHIQLYIYRILNLGVIGDFADNFN